jgi:hypothetical protein
MADCLSEAAGRVLDTKVTARALGGIVGSDRRDDPLAAIALAFFRKIAAP